RVPGGATRLLQEVKTLRRGDVAQARAKHDIGCPAQGLDEAYRETVADPEVLGAATRDRIARHLEGAERDLAGRLDLEQRPPLGQPTGGRRGPDDAEQRLAELR